MIRVCMYANRINGRYQENYLTYERSLIRAGIPFELTIDGRPFLWENRVKWQLETVLRHPEDHYVFTDVFDMLFVGVMEELREAVLPHDLIFTTDRMNRQQRHFFPLS